MLIGHCDGDWLVQVRLAVDEKDKPTVEACSDILQKAVRQRRYLLKKKYFTDIPANQVRTTSPVSSLTNDQWLELVQMWSTAKAKVWLCCTRIFFLLYICWLQLTCLPYRQLLQSTGWTVLRSGTIKRQVVAATFHTCICKCWTTDTVHSILSKKNVCLINLSSNKS